MAIKGKQAKDVCRILGVDTALRTTGYGLVDTDGYQYHAVDCGIIRNKPKLPLSECLKRLSAGIREITETYAPDIAVIEGAFYFENAKTAMLLGSARGAVIAALSNYGLPIYEYSPRKAKQAVCGHGNASKEQVAHMMSQMLNLDISNIPDDATDALSLCICHSQMATNANGLLCPDPI